MQSTQEKFSTITVCKQSDLIVNSGINALVDGQQVALFYSTTAEPKVYAIGNWDPIGKANVLSRGIVCDIDGRLTVASPLYKQHFDLITGKCLEDSEVSVPVYDASIVVQHVQIKL
ncbi:MAG: nitrite reductase (NADH) small subunit [Oceanicoccus sp.]|jgi:nitrite reductase (NADH) small subunit